MGYAIIDSSLIGIQNDVEIWHKNLLSDEGTGTNVYDSLKRVNELFFKDRQDAINYYQELIARQLVNEREANDVWEFVVNR